MKKNYKFYGLLICCLLFSCKATKYTPKDYPDIQLIFGEGGGISGQVNEYHLFENGILFKGKGMVDKTYEKIGKISTTKASQFFANYNALDVEMIEFDHPGNIYKFIEWKKGDQRHRITWGAMDHQVDKNVQLLYSLFHHQLSTLNTK